MKKIKEKINKFKEIWANQRYRSFILLGFYFVFFLVLSIGFRTSKSLVDLDETNQSFDSKTIVTNLENFVKQDYEYQIQINEQYEIFGKVENGINSFFYQDKQYTIIYKKLYINENETLNLVSSFLDVTLNIEDIMVDRIIEKIKQGTLSNSKQIDNEFELLYYIDSFDVSSNGEIGAMEIKLKGINEFVEQIEVKIKNDTYIIKIKE